MPSILDQSEEKIQSYLKQTGTTRQELEEKIASHKNDTNDVLIETDGELPDNHLTQTIDFEIREDE